MDFKNISSSNSMAAILPPEEYLNAAERGELAPKMKPSLQNASKCSPSGRLSKTKMARGFIFLVLLFGITIGAVIWRGFVMLT